ncbi:MAG: rhodanese-like domain-containing protein [Ilumatobacter sp.]|uniref:rhodanese-like domain-containing protein n=1 Tax=Ilumatobacter sp. TaxID=1967498 RepID=UPI003298A369
MVSTRSFLSAALVASVVLAACGGSDSGTSADSHVATQVEATDAEGVRVVPPTQAAATIADSPEDLVILDVRTKEEFDEGHIEGAVLLDFSRDDFAEELAKFDPDVPYVLYCRSGNRSSGTREIMVDLGFRSVEDVDGGIVGWQAAGLPLIAG